MSNIFKIAGKKNAKLYSLCAQRLYLSAEDNFMHFHKYELALAQVNRALEISPKHVNALILKGDLLLFKGKIKKALECYTQASFYNQSNPKALGCIAVCLDMLGEYEKSLEICNLAFSFMHEYFSLIYPSLYELKSSLLIKLNRFNCAKQVLNNAKINLSPDSISILMTDNQKITDHKLKLKARIKISPLKIVSS